jgi:sulfate/thiosulfate transport system permease protein
MSVETVRPPLDRPAHTGSGRLISSWVAGLPWGRWTLRTTALLYLGLMVALPIAAVVTTGFRDGFGALRDGLSTPGAVHALVLTLVASATVALVNGIFGTLLAYVLVRYEFPGRSVLAAVCDLPFAIPTLVTGVMLVALYGPNSPVGGFLARNGLQVAFAVPGIVLALLVITLPFVVRTVEPVLLELDVEQEEAARSLGAGGWTTFRRVVFPALRPAIAAGILLSFARALGEFGSIVIIAGNITGKTLTAPVFIFQLVNQFRYAEAAAVSTLLFGLSATLVFVTERLVSGRRSDR